MDHSDILLLALLEMAKREYPTKLGSSASPTGGDDLISAEVVRNGNPTICWTVHLTYASGQSFEIEMGSEGQNACVYEPAKQVPNILRLVREE